MKIGVLPSWVERGQMVHVTDHVTNVVRDIKSYSDRIDVYWNEQSEEFDLVERCLDGSQRLIFSVTELDDRVMPRLRRADHWYGQDRPTHIRPDGEDFVAETDAYNDRMQREQDEAGMDKIRAAGEELAWSLDIVVDQPSVGGSILVSKDLRDG